MAWTSVSDFKVDPRAERVNLNALLQEAATSNHLEKKIDTTLPHNNNKQLS